jgi:ABC-type histidine transport system ATPase subunit
VHLFDEPQFSTQDGYIGFMIEFFRRLRRDGRLVFVCLHPTEVYHLDILRELCERFVFVHEGRVFEVPDFASLVADARVSAYLAGSVGTPDATASATRAPGGGTARTR